MLQHEQTEVIAIRALKLVKTISLHLKQVTLQEQTTWLYPYLELDPTFKQTKRVLGMLRKFPGPESIQNVTLYVYGCIC